MKKKLLSLAIILAMAISLFSVTAFADDVESVTYTYSFNPNDLTTGTYLNTYTYTETEDTWAYVDEYGLRTLVSSYTDLFPVSYKAGSFSGMAFRGASSCTGSFWVAVKIKIPTAGTYKSTLGYGMRDVGALMNVFVLPADAALSSSETSFDSEYKLNSAVINTNSGETDEVAKILHTISLDNTFTTAAANEERIVVFAADSANTNAYAYIANLTLTKVADVEVEDYADYTFSYELNSAGIESGKSIVNQIDYADSKGMLNWDSKSNDSYDVRAHKWGIEIRADGEGQWVAFKINIPAAGTYKASLTHGQSKTMGGYGNVYLLPGNTADISVALPNITLIGADVAFVNTSSNIESTLTEFEEKVVAETAGEYLLVFKASKIGDGTSPSYRMYPNTFTLTGDGNNPAYAGVVTVSSEIENGTTVTEAVRVWNTVTGEEITEGITLTSSNTDVATVSGTTITAAAAGDTTITATCSSPAVGNIVGADVTVVPTAQEKVNAAFDAAPVVTEHTEPAVISISKDGSEIKSVKNSDGTHNITAPETNSAGAKFLYWAKGLSAQKRILIGKTNELTNYVPDAEYANYLIPVYENEISGTEFYNANGQLLPDATENDRPYMAGYGVASGWNQYGTNIYVAEYNNKTQPDDVTVTVVDGSGTETVPYGDPVTCTADEDTYGTFRWWQREVNGAQEIVSVDKKYSFLAYETCTVTAVYGDSAVSVTNPAKIIIDTFGENSIMAEFIGFGSNVVEKGIMWNSKKIAMTAPGSQFTVTADKAGTNTFVGYAIVGNATDGYTLITDGEATITIAE